MNNFLRIIKRFSSSKPQQSVPKLKFGEAFRTHETKTGDVVHKWNYRSEYLRHKKLNNGHYFVWISFALLSVFGGIFFIITKTSVVENRKEELLMRESVRKELKLANEDRKKIGSLNSVQSE
uniref:Uncharacterized protein n=1 Tax=Strongyloides stercoralis TaxID=6248 RepID=A0A0K0EQ59_STRER